tara:strand:- start:264 stop:374 length:111 start_codon:yes stop_codon:yes gene_type:complete
MLDAKINMTLFICFPHVDLGGTVTTEQKTANPYNAI